MSRKRLNWTAPRPASSVARPPLGGAQPVRGPLAGLTAGQREVMVLVAAGLSNAAIAARLGISPRAVTARIQRVMELAGAHNRAEAVHILTRAGLI